MDTKKKLLKTGLLSELAARHRKLGRLVWLLSDARGVADELELDAETEALRNLIEGVFEVWAEMKPAVDAAEIKLYTEGDALEAGYEN